jgi:hypothetical protein
MLSQPSEPAPISTPTRATRQVRNAIPTPKPSPAPPPPPMPAQPLQPAASGLPPVSGISLAGSVKAALADRLRARLMALSTETLLMAITIAEMLEDE